MEPERTLEKMHLLTDVPSTHVKILDVAGIILSKMTLS
jgi:hypothetical protein